MPRAPKLGKVNGYWDTKAGDQSGVYFGKVGGGLSMPCSVQRIARLFPAISSKPSICAGDSDVRCWR